MKNKQVWQFNYKRKIIGNRIYYAHIAYDSKERAEWLASENRKFGYLTQVLRLKKRFSKTIWWAVYIHKPGGLR